MGTVSVPVEKDTDPATVRVLDENQRPLPFTISGDSLQFFSGAPGTVACCAATARPLYSLTLPDVAEAVWKPPANVRRGIPRAAELESPPQDLWPWLAVAGRPGIAARLAAVRTQPPVPHQSVEHRELAAAVVRNGKHHDLRTRLGSRRRLAAASLGGLGMAAHAPPLGFGAQDATFWRFCSPWPSRAQCPGDQVSPWRCWWTPRPAFLRPISTVPRSLPAPCSPRRAVTGCA